MKGNIDKKLIAGVMGAAMALSSAFCRYYLSCFFLPKINFVISFYHDMYKNSMQILNIRNIWQGEI